MCITLKRFAPCWLAVTCLLTTALPAVAGADGAEHVGRDGRRLVRGDRPIHLHGATLYGANYQDPAAFKKYVDGWLDKARGQGINLVRAVNFYDRTTDWFDPKTWGCVDQLFAAAEKRGMYVELDLSAYRNGLWDAGVNPYADPSRWNDYLDFVGGRYKGRANLAFYALAGEIVGPNYGESPKVSGQAYIDFFRATSDRLRAADPNHLISSGGFLHLSDPHSGIPWKEIFGLPNIQMAAVHVYSDPAITDNDDVRAAVTVAEWARQQGIPFTIEEFGAVQSIGDAARADLFARRYTLSALTGSVATIFWNLGPEDRGDSHDVGPQTPQTWAAVAAGGSYFRDGFDDAFPKPTWTDKIESSEGIVGISGDRGTAPECGVGGKVAHSGRSALTRLRLGTDRRRPRIFCDFKVYPRRPARCDRRRRCGSACIPRATAPATCRSTSAARNGTRLRDTPPRSTRTATPSNRPPVTAGRSRSASGRRSSATSASGLEGKTVNEIVVGYDRPDAAGPFRGHIDDLLITDGPLE